MPFSLERDEHATVVTVEGILDTHNRMQFKQLVLDEVARGGRRFRIDCRGASYIDSSGLGALVSLSKIVRGQGGEIRIANLNADLRKVFELTRLDLVFRLEDNGRERYR